MIKMAVGQQDCRESDSQLAALVQNIRSVVSRVNDHTLLGLIVINQVTVGTHLSQYACLNPNIAHFLPLHHSYPVVLSISRTPQSAYLIGQPVQLIGP